MVNAAAMDRAAFLRSLNFLRPLPPGVWDSCVASIDGNDDDDDGAYSGSTITPPTPSRKNSTLVFDGPPFVVSIEPAVRSEGRVDGNGRRDDRSDDGRKRLRADDDLFGGATCGPAFFNHRPIITETDEARHDVADAAAANARNMDVEPDNVQRGGLDGGGIDWKYHVNSDPALCTFEAAIIKTISSESEIEEVRGNAVSTPEGLLQATNHGTGEVESKSLMFRFGNRFAFHVDESAILEIRYEPGSDGERYDGDNRHRNDAGDQTTNNSPPSKLHKNEGDGFSRAEKSPPVRAKKHPPSLTISFGSCNFRVFSLECSIIETTAAETTRPSSRIWSTLTSMAETAEDRLVNARSALIQHFVDSRESKRSRDDADASSWMMAPPGSGLVFHVWPSNAPTYRSSSFVDEDWSCCLGGNHGTIKCASAASSPQKSSSTSGSSSTNFEHGQKEQQAHSMNWSENENIGKSQNKENDEAFHQASGRFHESEKLDDERCGVELSESQTPLPALKNNHNKSETNTKGRIKENRSDTSLLSESDNKKKVGEDGPGPQSWKDEVRNKYHLFQSSAVHMELTNSAAVSSQHPGNVSVVSHINSCAESLTKSYLSVEEFKEMSQQFENEIVHATSEMERELERMFPARGRKSNSAPIGKNVELQRKFYELMSSRKEAVVAKLSLLMIPKR
ncbi:hypothetical protein ACHAXA_004863 [Cyclostephanos tholiformis]|uniref:Uncharacterized protein n=1 Tax=Cyclostephanos tholiformis TaxID=382380 RepID=A0ABD3SH33_9STRA